MIIMARRQAGTQATACGGKISSVVGGPGVVIPLQITRVLGGLLLDREVLQETTSGIVVRGRNGSMVIMACRRPVRQATTFGRRIISVVGRPGVVRPVQITSVPDGLLLDREILGESTSGIVIDGAPDASEWI